MTKIEPTEPVAIKGGEGSDGYTYTDIDPEAAVEDFVRERAKQAAFDAALAALNVAQVAILDADAKSPVGQEQVTAAADDKTEKDAKAARLAAKTSNDFDPAAEIADAVDAWKVERRPQLERERAALAWLRDNPDEDDEDQDRAEQVRQVEAAITAIAAP